ncbi:hypothetical protein GLOIN_2v1610601 [Rhizophagus clarus]|uniref:Uncharacterized protein n=1 Tax=Rhizophagus clarus TaxID=94130 RepID=A0A8H3LR18_9GLOM|nr:hypothetical protein GLOIN_2v1610601 [Rhizophagus clarus]
MISEPFRYELEKYSRQYTPITSNKSAPQWTHISQPSIIILENMFPSGTIINGVGEPMLKVVSDQNVLLESLNVSYRYADSLKAKALLKSPTIGIRYNYTVLGDNAMLICQETRKIQLRFKYVSDFESCASIIERYVNCRRMDDPTLNLNSESSISNQSNQSQGNTNLITYNDLNLNRAQREPSVANARAGQHQQLKIGPQNHSSSAFSASSYTSAFSDNARNSMIQRDENNSKSQLQDSQSHFTNNINMRHSVGSQQNSKVQEIRKNNLSRSTMNDIELYQSNISGIQDQNQQIKLPNTSVRQRNSLTNSLPRINSQYMASAEVHSSKYTADEHRYMSVPPQVSTHETHKAPLWTQSDQFSRQSQPATHKINIENSQRTFIEQENVERNETDITKNNLSITDDASMRSSYASNINTTSQPSLQSMSLNSRNVTNCSQSRFESFSDPQISQKNILQNTPSLQLPRTPNRIIANSKAVQQVKIKQEKMDISPALHKKEPYFIDLTMNDDDNRFELDFQPTKVPVSHIQAEMRKSQSSLTNQSQFAQSIVSQVHLQPTNSDQFSTLHSTQNTSSVKQISPQNTCLSHDGLQNLRNQSLFTIQPANNNSIRQNIPLPEDDEELQDWILDILKDPNFPQFISRVEKLWKMRLLAYDL